MDLYTLLEIIELQTPYSSAAIAKFIDLFPTLADLFEPPVEKNRPSYALLLDCNLVNTIVNDYRLVARVNNQLSDIHIYPIAEHYLAYRLDLINFTAALFKADLDKDHIYNQIIHPVVDKLLGKDNGKTIVEILLNQFEFLSSKKVPKEVANSQKQTVFWAKHYLSEQKAILELLSLIHYTHVTPTPPLRILKFLSTFLNVKFGRAQVNAVIFDADSTACWNQVCHLTQLITIEVFNCEDLMVDSHTILNAIISTASSATRIENTVLFQDPKTILEIHRLISSIDDSDFMSIGSANITELEKAVHGPILLLWSCFLTRLKVYVEAYDDNHDKRDKIDFYQSIRWIIGMQADGGSLIQVFIERAFKQLQCANHLLLALKSCREIENQNMTIVNRSVMKGFLMLLCISFPINRLPDFEILAGCFKYIFEGCPLVITQFWDEDLAIIERASILLTARARFPIQFSPFISLVKSLIADQNSAEEAFKYITNIQTFTQTFPKEYFEFSLNGDPLCKYKQQFRPSFASTKTQKLEFSINPPCVGTIVYQKPFTVQLMLAYSLFHFMFAHLDSFLGLFDEDGKPIDYRQPLESGYLTPPCKDIVSDFLDLLKRFLSHCDKGLFDKFILHCQTFFVNTSTATQNTSSNDDNIFFQPPPLKKSKQFDDPIYLTSSMIVDRICRLLSISCNQKIFASPPKRLITSCLEIISLFLGRIPTLVWSHLRHESLIPRYSKVFDVSSLKSGVGIDTYYQSNSYLQQTILPFEKASGRHTTTLAFLDLVVKLVRQAILTDCVDMAENEEDVGGGDYLKKVKSEVLVSCVVFVQREIFPFYSNWRYVQAIEKYQIGLKICTIFNMIFRDTSLSTVLEENADGVSSERTGLAFIQNYLAGQFLQFGTFNQIFPLLDLIGVGQKFISNLLVRRPNEGAIFDQSVVQAFLLLKVLLKIRIRSGISWSLLEEALLERSVVSDVNLNNPESSFSTNSSISGKKISRNEKSKVDLILVIAEYINYEANLNLMLLSCQVLTLICQATSLTVSIMENSDITPASKSKRRRRPPMSLLAYFGSSAEDIAGSFIRLAKQDKGFVFDTKSLRGMTKLKLISAIFLFIEVVVVTQPGLACLFLQGGVNKQQGNSSQKIVESEKGKEKEADVATATAAAAADDKMTIINVIVAHLEDLSRHPKLNIAASGKSCIFVAIFGLIDVIWQKSAEYRSFVIELTSRRFFWDLLKSIIEKTPKLPDFNDEETILLDNEVLLQEIGDEMLFQLGSSEFGQSSVGFKSNFDADVKAYSEECIVISHSLRILAMEVYFGLMFPEGGNVSITTANNSAIITLDFVYDNFGKGKAFKLFESGIELSCDDDVFEVLDECTKRGLQLRGGPKNSLASRKISLGDFRQLFKDESFGDQFFYDVELLVFKHNFSVFDEEDELMDIGDGGGKPTLNSFQFLCKLLLFNHIKSISHAQLELVKSWRYFFEVVSSRTGYLLWDKSNSPKKDLLVTSSIAEIPKMDDIKELPRLIFKICKTLDNEKREDLIVLEYRSELAELLFVLVKRWSGSFTSQTLSTNVEKDIFKDAVSILGRVQNCLQNDIHPLVDSKGGLSSLRAHQSLFSSLFVILKGSRVLLRSVCGSISKDVIKDYRQIILGLFSILGETLLSLLNEFEISNFEENIGVLKKEGGVSTQTILFSIVVELIYSCDLIDPSSWIPIIEKFELIPKLLKVFAVSITSLVTDPKQSVKLFRGRSPDSLSSDILHIFIALSNYGYSAERLAFYGIMKTFASNSMSPFLIDGSVKSYIGNDRNELHIIWCMMLSVINRLLEQLWTSSVFVNGAASLLSLYWNQIETSFNSSKDITGGDLEEVKRISQLFYALGRYIGKSKGVLTTDMSGMMVVSKIKSVYQDLGARLLAQSSYFFVHPHIMASSFAPSSKFMLDQKSSSTTTTTLLPYDDLVKQYAETTMLLACKNVVSFLVVTTNAEDVFLNWCRGGKGLDDENGDISNIVFQVSSVNYTEGMLIDNETSIGALFELFNFIISTKFEKVNPYSKETTQQKQQEGTASSTTTSSCSISVILLLQFAESLLILIVSQMVSFTSLVEVDATRKNDLVNELKSEITQSVGLVQSKLSVLASSPSWKDYHSVLKDSLKFVEVVSQSLRDVITKN